MKTSHHHRNRARQALSTHYTVELSLGFEIEPISWHYHSSVAAGEMVRALTHKMSLANGQLAEVKLWYRGELVRRYLPPGRRQEPSPSPDGIKRYPAGFSAFSHMGQNTQAIPKPEPKIKMPKILPVI